MKCDDVKALLMDFLYEEISDEDKKLFQTHLSNCDSCRQEFQSLKQTSNLLQQSEDVEPKLNLVFISETKSFWNAVKQKFSVSPKKLIYGVAIGFASIILLLSLTNTEVSYQNGDFSVKMSILPRKLKPQNETINEDVIARLQQQNISLINKLIQQSEERQRQQLFSTLAQFSDDFENRRTADLQLVGVGLDEIEKSIYSRLEKRTNSQFNNLIRYINAQQGQK